MKDAVDLDIHIRSEPLTGVITITDSGIGMTRKELVDCLGTVNFLKALKENKGASSNNSVIGRYGVGFYSAFLVSNRVAVTTKSPKSGKQYVWEGEANATSYTIREETDPKKLLARGTCVTLYLKPGRMGFALPQKIQELVKNYPRAVLFPIYTWQDRSFLREVDIEEDPTDQKTDGEDGKAKRRKKIKTVIEDYWDWELTNNSRPIWLRNPREVTTKEYNEFYTMTFNEDYTLASTHFTIEDDVEFRSILYVPTWIDDKPKLNNIRFYFKGVFISDAVGEKLLPSYLNFIRGVVDLHDLPLDVSLENYQESRIDYEFFWEFYGRNLKEACMKDCENCKLIAPLLRFFSSQREKRAINLDEYVELMKPDQKDIYYIGAESLTSARNLPFLEKIIEKDFEVLFLVDPYEELAVQNLERYKDKKFVDISKEDLDLGDENEKIKQKFGPTCNWIKKQLGDQVSSVQISNRLSTSPCVLVSGEFSESANIEALMKSQNLLLHEDKPNPNLISSHMERVFEINPEHEIIKYIYASCNNGADDPEAVRTVKLLYNTALISSGFTGKYNHGFENDMFDTMADGSCHTEDHRSGNLTQMSQSKPTEEAQLQVLDSTNVVEKNVAPKKRGRPPKRQVQSTENDGVAEKMAPKKRGRPPKRQATSIWEEMVMKIRDMPHKWAPTLAEMDPRICHFIETCKSVKGDGHCGYRSIAYLRDYDDGSDDAEGWKRVRKELLEQMLAYEAKYKDYFGEERFAFLKTNLECTIVPIMDRDYWFDLPDMGTFSSKCLQLRVCVSYSRIL